MAATQFRGGALSGGLTTRASDHNPTTKKARLFNSLKQSEAGKFGALSGGKDLSNANVVGGCSLSATHRALCSPLLTRPRRPCFPVVANQLSSDIGVGSSEVKEKLALEEEHALINGGSDELQTYSPDVKRELLVLSLPAILGQAIDPLAQLMETAYIGRLGSVELASAGISMNIFNYISKLFNIPLLSVATSFVAEDLAKSESKASTSENGCLGDITNGKPERTDGVTERKQLSSVSTALLLSVGIGIFEAVALSLGSGLFLNMMGISMDSPMRIPAQRFLSLRAIGAPAVVASLALQGVFRGFKDTKTPVLCLGIGNLLAAFLLPILMYYFGLGVTGAALSTVISQYTVTFLMIWFLNKRAILLPPKVGSLQFGGYIKSGGFLLGRTLAVLTTLTFGTSMAARQGPVAMAAHQICIQVWLAVSLLTDAMAASGQALIASYLSKGEYKIVKEVADFVLKIGLFTGVSLSVILGLSFGSLATLFTKDPEVLLIVRSGILFVSASQPLNALAYVFDGLHFGVSDFAYAARSMMVVGAISSAFLLYAPSILGLHGVWLGLTLFMGLRAVAGYARFLSKSGPWWFVHTGIQKAQLAI
ncbi:protein DETOXIFICATION 45 chloroplastic isoform X1 [Prunus yedoensis var. nudiflora]|uniref:Protein DETOXIFICATION n=1 Tax=Prunus yedoensis var. nudiflora TaxID=2094558 RepID=A0A314ZEF5_PRUYE|nr:protein DETOXIFICATION 45 chloroplastic isoform X1 [Prunus yedoensis var. nudiflora]